ncbi:sensor domain-containing protein [Mycobacterium hubeiense]|uniref:sensor domain-containing protein n=1 Tax=Mycobacterium hubeiense TaxID=1867256 RepID=UPI001157A575|nr:sensor domain-containing protein [Mycobacterium sp. QGD 101]
MSASGSDDLDRTPEENRADVLPDTALAKSEPPAATTTSQPDTPDPAPQAQPAQPQVSPASPAVNPPADEGRTVRLTKDVAAGRGSTQTPAGGGHSPTPPPRPVQQPQPHPSSQPPPPSQQPHQGPQPHPGPQPYPGPQPPLQQSYAMQPPPPGAPGSTGFPYRRPWNSTGPQRNTRRLWLFSALATVIILVAAAVIVVFVVRDDDEATAGDGQTTHPAAPDAGTRAAEPAGPPVPTSALPDLLLTDQEAATALGQDKMDAVTEIQDGMYVDEVVDQECVSVAYVLQQSSYGSTGYVAARRQRLDSPTQDPKLSQSVVSFSDAAAAAKYVADQIPTWEKCSNRTVNLRATGDEPGDVNKFWEFGPMTNTDGTLQTFSYQEGAGGWVCQRGLAARNNIVIDFWVCGTDVPDTVVPNIVNAAAEKIDAHQ